MFNNIGSKIKMVAQVCAWLGIIASVLGGIIMLVTSKYNFWGILVIILGSLVSWLSTASLYGFGQLIENSDILVEQNKEIINNMATNNNSNHVAEKDKMPQNEPKISVTASADMRHTCSPQKVAVTTAEPVIKKYSISPITISSNFVDAYSWKNDIAHLTNDEIYARYLDSEKWSSEYRQLCFLELQSRHLIDE